MNSLSDIATSIKESNETFLDFKNRLLARIESLETREAKMNRRSLPGTGPARDDTETPGDQAERKAFRAYCAKGSMEGLETKSVNDIGTGADGGVLVPKFINQQIEKVALNYSPMRMFCKVTEALTSDYHKIVTTKRSASGWAGEQSSRPPTDAPGFKDVTFPLADLFAFPQVTQWMLDDAGFNFDQWIAQEIGEVFGNAEAAGFISGSGTSQPWGFLSVPNATTVDGMRPFGTLKYLPTGVAGGFASSNPADFLISMVFDLKVGYRPDSVWLMNPHTLQAIRSFKDLYGRYLIDPSVQAGSPPTLFGYPVYEAEDMPIIAAGSISIAFGSFMRGYEIVDRMPTRMLRDPFSNKPFVGIYATKRTSGNVVNSEAIRLAKFTVS